MAGIQPKNLPVSRFREQTIPWSWWGSQPKRKSSTVSNYILSTATTSLLHRSSSGRSLPLRKCDACFALFPSKYPARGRPAFGESARGANLQAIAAVAAHAAVAAALLAAEEARLEPAQNPKSPQGEAAANLLELEPVLELGLDRNFVAADQEWNLLPRNWLLPHVLVLVLLEWPLSKLRL